MIDNQGLVSAAKTLGKEIAQSISDLGGWIFFGLVFHGCVTA